jgi:hypothetical protein
MVRMHEPHVETHKSPKPHLDNEVKVTEIIVERGRSVAPGDGLAVDLGRDGDVLTDRETETRVGRKTESVAGYGVSEFGNIMVRSKRFGRAMGRKRCIQCGVVGDVVLADQLELLPLIRLQDLFRLSRRRRGNWIVVDVYGVSQVRRSSNTLYAIISLSLSLSKPTELSHDGQHGCHGHGDISHGEPFRV